MYTSSIALASFAAIAQVARADYGWQFANALSTGPTATNTFIREANTTLILPDTNSPQTGNLALWPGMGTSANDLVQGLAISVADGSAGCAKASGKWCVVASALQDDTQEMGAYVTASPGDHITFHCKSSATPSVAVSSANCSTDLYVDSSSEYQQTVSLNGAVVSTISTASGEAEGWGTAVECQSAACGSVPAHQYIDTKIVMNTADPGYIDTLGTTGATGDMVTADGGLTWTIETITIDAYTFT